MRNADQDEITALLTAMRAGTSSNIAAAHSPRINDRGAPHAVRYGSGCLPGRDARGRDVDPYNRVVSKVGAGCGRRHWRQVKANGASTWSRAADRRGAPASRRHGGIGQASPMGEQLAEQVILLADCGGFAAIVRGTSPIDEWPCVEPRRSSGRWRGDRFIPWRCARSAEDVDRGRRSRSGLVDQLVVLEGFLPWPLGGQSAPRVR